MKAKDRINNLIKMNMLKRIWNDPVWSKVIAAIIISMGAIIYSFVVSKMDDSSFWNTLLKTLISPYFSGLIILLLLGYIIFDKLKKQKNAAIKSINTEGRYTWIDIENGVKNIKEQLISDNYIPSLLVGIGRGGAIVSSLLSGNMIRGKHIPFIALERKYNEDRGMRKASLFDDVIFKKDLDKVLLVAGDVYTGDTAGVFIDFLERLGAKEIRFCVFAKVNSTNRKPDYFSVETNVTKLTFPWMLSNNYLTDARIQ